MAQDNHFLTTAEFASRSGISNSRLSKLIREGKIEAVKKSGKWRIPFGQLQAKILQKPVPDRIKRPQKAAFDTPSKKAVARPPKSAAAEEKTGSVSGQAYTISEFADVTYLTESGVRRWLKQGRRVGRQNKQGEWLIDFANLQVPDVKQLVREDKIP